MSSPVVALARATHFAPTVAVTAFSAVLAVSADKGGGAVLIAAAVLAGQLSVGWSNDFVDRNRDRSAGRRDKPIVAGQIDERTVAVGAGVAALGCVALSLATGWISGLVHIAAVASAWSYNLGLKRTWFSPLPFVVSFGLLPVFICAARPDPFPAPAWVIAAGAALGAAAHLTNVLPDLDSDAATGVQGFPHRIGARASLLVAALLLAVTLVAAAFTSGAATTPPVLAIVAVGLALVIGVLVAGAAGRGRLAFRLTIAAAGIAVLAVLVRGL